MSNIPDPGGRSTRERTRTPRLNYARRLAAAVHHYSRARFLAKRGIVPSWQLDALHNWLEMMSGFVGEEGYPADRHGFLAAEHRFNLVWTSVEEQRNAYLRREREGGPWTW